MACDAKNPKSRKNAKKSVKYVPENSRFSAKADVFEHVKYVSYSRCAGYLGLHSLGEIVRPMKWLEIACQRAQSADGVKTPLRL
jgi:hypothetical protein